MMIVQMDKMSAPSSRERAQRLYEKTIELENKRRRSAQARVPSDPNAWQLMRENYEAIILEDHGFSEQHNIEYTLWQLHYRRIEELRAHFSAALASTGSNTSQGAKGPARPDRVAKIRLQFKTFLSEATGFYHELILKIRAKYGLPLGYFSEDSENLTAMERDGKKSADVKKGMVSCHRCLIYLGDLARYKGLYGEGDSRTREYATASSYYLQAASLWPSSGNPHHQLAILASYSADELVAIYRYFRSLAVESPFSTARDNLIVAFEKNRQSYCQLPGDGKVSVVKESAGRPTGKGRGKGEGKLASKDTIMEASPGKEKVSNIKEAYKHFSIRFVRLNGILFTRTSLETFAEVLTLASSRFRELLSSGPGEELNFGADIVENALAIVRLVAILIYTVHNSKRENEGQTYAEIVQRAVLLQNAFTAAFDFMGHIIERCVQLHEPSASYLLPGILVFLEWLACCPDIAAGSDVDEKQAIARSNFWNHCISFLNKILSVGSESIDDDDDGTCFFNMSKYEVGETENRALWEDFELRGFLPLLPAQTILDFSRKHSHGSDGIKERKARIKRILAAGKALANVVRVDQKPVCYDSKAKKFVVGVEALDDFTLLDSSIPNDMRQDNQAENIINMGGLQPSPQLYVDGEDDDEVIVFKPVMTENKGDVIGPKQQHFGGLKSDQNASAGDLKLYGGPFEGLKSDQSASSGDLQLYGGPVSVPLDNCHQRTAINVGSQIPLSVGNILPQHLHQLQQHNPNWLLDEETLLASSFKGLSVTENGHAMKQEMQENIGFSHPVARSVPIQQSVNVNTSGMFYSQIKAPDVLVPSKIDAVASSGVAAESLAAKTSLALATGLRKNPVSRPVRHLGPPPGFSPVPPKPINELSSGLDLTGETAVIDDYSWLDGYHVPQSTKGSGFSSSINYQSHANPQYINSSNGLTGTVSFPFPGKHVPAMQFQMEKPKDYQPIDHLKLQPEQQLQQHLINGNQQFTTLPEQYQGQSIWSGRYFV